VTNREGKVISVPDTGAVFRCEPDGANFEVFATGLRNPQELAFDARGDLWTADNNGDGGDKARWLLLQEGADYGWTLGWQWLPKMGAWNSERLWHPRASNPAAAQVPAIANIGHGPASGTSGWNRTALSSASSRPTGRGIRGSGWRTIPPPNRPERCCGNCRRWMSRSHRSAA
jgi:hypothetical protein